MTPARLRSHLYLKAIRWLAQEDPKAVAGLDALELSQTVPVKLCSHLWNRPPLLVAREVLEERRLIL